MSVKSIISSEIEREQLLTILKKSSVTSESETAQTILMLSEDQTVFAVANQQNVKPEAIRERRR